MLHSRNGFWYNIYVDLANVHVDSGTYHQNRGTPMLPQVESLAEQKKARNTNECQTIKLFNVETHSEFFKDSAAMDAFLAALVQKLAGDGLIILTRGETVLATMRSEIPTKEAFQWRIAARLAADPSLLDELKERAGDGEFVRKAI